MTDYRYPSETAIFWGTIILVSLVIILTSAATFCLAGVFILAFFGMAYLSNKSHHQSLIYNAERVDLSRQQPLSDLIRLCQSRLKPGSLDVFVVRENQLNAYTFGVDSPKAIVIYSPMFQLMDAEELMFVLGHEMGHISLGHTWLNTILGGLAGIPAPYGAAVILAMIFRSWNRACEYSADRAGMIACKNPEKAITALLKLVSGDTHLTEGEKAQWIRLLDKQDDSLSGQLQELLSSHPMITKRISQIKEYAGTADYARLISMS
jgi:Zn-dependent protease with chaperone function